MDKKMRKVTAKIRKAESSLKKAEKENMRLADYDEKVRDPEIKKFHTMEKSMKCQTKKDKMDESLGMRRGKEATKMQSMKDRRHESMGMKKHKKVGKK